MNEYPTDEELKKIVEWPCTDFKGLMDFVHALWWPDYGRGQDYGQGQEWGWKQRGRTYRLATGGWSGNESIVGALQSNTMFWTLCWWSSQRGGLYIFKLRKIARATEQEEK